MPVKTEVSIDELISSRKDISDDNGVLYKAHVGPRSWSDEERSAVFIMSAETEDSYGDIVMQSGIDLKARFATNPVALFGHRSWDMPIGDWHDIKMVRSSPKRTEGKLKFTDEGVDEVTDRVARNVKAGKLRASSIGFMPKSFERILDDEGEWTYGFKFHEVELYECSVVTIPAVREALVKGAGGKAEDIVSPEVIAEFLEHLKANPGLAKMINRDLYDGVYREITGNKTTLQIEAPAWLGEVRTLTERMEKAARHIPGVEEDPADPEIDEIAKGIEVSVEKALEEFAPKVEELDEPERKGALTKLMDGIRSLFRAAEPLVEPAPVAADPDTQKTLRDRVDELAARYPDAA